MRRLGQGRCGGLGGPQSPRISIAPSSRVSVQASSALWQLGLEIFRLSRLDTPIQQGFMDLLREQALASDVGKPAVLNRITRCGDGMFLEYVQAA